MALIQTLNCKKRASESANGESGSALVYILIAIALLAALTVTFMEPSSQQTSSQSGFRTLSSVQSQADTIRSALQECILLYPNGDTTIPSAGYEAPFPLIPNSTHLPTTGGYRASDVLVRNIRCPGSNDGDVNQHRLIFSGTKFMPPAPDLFNDWKYYNGTEGVFFWTATSKSDAFLDSALEKLDAKYGNCEADIIDARSSAVDLNDDSGTGDGFMCAAGELCFRIWMALNGTPGTHQDC
jgi:hypothetical protein